MDTEEKDTEEKIMHRKKFEIKEEDKCCFHCVLIKCVDRHPRCARKLFLKNIRKIKRQQELKG